MNNYYNPAMRAQQYGRMQGYAKQARQTPYCNTPESAYQTMPCGRAAESGCQQPPVVGAFPADAVVAMAYVPFQQNIEVYDDMTALSRGTLFPIFDKPFEGCR